MRYKNDATGMTGPMVNIQCGVVFGEKRGAGITENRFNKIQIGD